MLEVKGLFYTYSTGLEALKGINLAVKDGEFLAIMGQNGAGKTTLVKHFNGLLKPTKGEVLNECGRPNRRPCRGECPAALIRRWSGPRPWPPGPLAGRRSEARAGDDRARA